MFCMGKDRNDGYSHSQETNFDHMKRRNLALNCRSYFFDIGTRKKLIQV